MKLLPIDSVIYALTDETFANCSEEPPNVKKRRIIDEDLIQRLLESLLCREHLLIDFVRDSFINEVLIPMVEINNLNEQIEWLKVYCGRFKFYRELVFSNGRPDFVIEAPDGKIAVLEIKWDDNNKNRIKNQIKKYLDLENAFLVCLLTKETKINEEYSDDPRYTHFYYSSLMKWLESVMEELFACWKKDHTLVKKTDFTNLLANCAAFYSLINPGETATTKERMSIRLCQLFKTALLNIDMVLNGAFTWEKGKDFDVIPDNVLDRGADYIIFPLVKHISFKYVAVGIVIQKGLLKFV